MQFFLHMSPPKFHLLRHVTTRNDSLSIHAFWYRKKSYVLFSACCTARATQHDTARHDERSKRIERDTSVTTSATGAIRNLICS